MKKLLNISLLIMAIALLANCGREDIVPPDLTDEYPRIFGSWPGVNDAGQLGAFTVRKDSLLSVVLQFTPSHIAVGRWFVDGVQVAEGPVLTQTFTTTGRRTVRLEVSTPANSTSRDAYIDVID